MWATLLSYQEQIFPAEKAPCQTTGKLEKDPLLSIWDEGFPLQFLC